VEPRGKALRSTGCALLLLPVLWVLAAPPTTCADEPGYWAGAARIDVTPDYPVRLSGFAFRKAESEGVRQPIWAKALALASRKDQPFVLVTLDSTAISDELVRSVAAELQEKHGLDPVRFALTVTHTHTAPMLAGTVATLFGEPIPPAHQERIERYTRELRAKLVEVAAQALERLEPASLSHAIGTVTLAVNRRTQGGPVDHDLPMLAVRDRAGKLKAVFISYACHCVTLSENRIGGDWAGYAQEQIERTNPGAMALVSIGCGADANPRSGVTGDKFEIAEAQGAEFATEVARLLKGPLRPVSGEVKAAWQRIELAFQKAPSREEWVERANRNDAVGYHARAQLARLDRGEQLRTSLSYPVQTLAFGTSLAMVFLPGEVVVDYSLRLKRELDGRRVWLNGYANAVPCYIPSERVLREGGYEGGDAMTYFDQPARLAPGLEQKIVDAVVGQIGKDFASPVDFNRTQGTRPLAPEQSLARMRVRPGLRVDLVAAEPLVNSPVAIEFGPDGKLWVAEMYDYPLGLDGQYQPGGRIRVLEPAVDGNGFVNSTVFLDGIPFPTGLTLWRDGLMICAAPDILFAQDTNGDGRADRVQKLFSGFGDQNYQGRVNSLEYGLDGWVYGSCGLFGGRIQALSGSVVELGDRDFRIKPDQLLLEPAVGRTQQGRPRDDEGNWFGCDNGTLCRHYPLPDHYVKRNPHLEPVVSSWFAYDDASADALYPARAELQLFKLSGPSGRPTAACGLGIYRDDLLGEEFRGNAFTCEPVNLLVHRMQLVPKGSSFAGRRPADERQTEFLASTDPWFRPVQVRTGPDGALWVVDMYRFVIEHPRWIPPEQLASVDVRAGHNMGRIYRILPANQSPRRVPRLDQMSDEQLVAELDGPNGVVRDQAMQLLLWRGRKTAAGSLERLAARGRTALGRMQALCTLDVLAGCSEDLLLASLADDHPVVRRHAARIAERRASPSRALRARLHALGNDADPQVRLQVALSLGEMADEDSPRMVGELAVRHADDLIMQGALVSSMREETALQTVEAALRAAGTQSQASDVIRRLVASASGLVDSRHVSRLLAAVARPGAAGTNDWQFSALAGLFGAVAQRGLDPEELFDAQAQELARHWIARARAEVVDQHASVETRGFALVLLGRQRAKRGEDAALAARLLAPDEPAPLQQSALDQLSRMGGDEAAKLILQGWQSYAPAMRSRALNVLLERQEWQRALLEHVKSGAIRPAEIDLARRQRLASQQDPQLQRLAHELFQEAPSPDRAKVIEEYRKGLAQPGDAGRGQRVFAKTCAVCHRLGGVGHHVGPDLAGLANKSAEFVLQEILDPSRNLDARYVAYTALTKSGMTFAGVVTAETATSITLRGQDGQERSFLRSSLEELVGSGKSFMPEGLEKDLSPGDVADLVALIISNRGPPKQIAGNTPRVVLPNGEQLVLEARTAEIHGGEITFEGPPFENIGYWHGQGDHVIWTVELPKAARYDVWLDYACDDAVAGNAFVLAAGGQLLSGKTAGTGGWNRYRQVLLGSLELQQGQERVTLRPDAAALNGALMDLRGVHLAPAGQRPGFVAAASPDAPADVKAAARVILDDTLRARDRERAINAQLANAQQLMAALVEDLQPGTQEEYRRIPWIWRLAIAVGKQNEADGVRGLLEAALPDQELPLRDWQAVVIGGGLINGISQAGAWPGRRIELLLENNKKLAARWREALRQSAAMAENEKVPTGTRYDALRMAALLETRVSLPLLAKYLEAGVNDELQMGAVSGLVDIEADEAGAMLTDALAHLGPANRELAIAGLTRTEKRALQLLTAVGADKIPEEMLGMVGRRRLLNHESEAVRKLAARLLSP
jgi:putative membrane-bound dehydrogenase-like protein